MLKLIVSVAVCWLLVSASPSNAIVASNNMYKDAQSRIEEIDQSIEQIKSSLTDNRLTPQQSRELNQLKDSLSDEKAIIKRRLKLLKALEKQGILLHLEERSSYLDDSIKPRWAERQPTPHASSRVVEFIT